MKTITGLSQVHTIADKFKGNVGYLCHAASIDTKYQHGILKIKNEFGKRLTKLFSPQHGIFADVQDNMVESDHFIHKYFDLPVYSLYSETRKPTKAMLDGLEAVIVDLQDVGTRVYTYIYTMTYMLEACAEYGVKVFILDRPNPIGGTKVEGNILDLNYQSFVGRHALPMRHGMTMGEVAMMAKHHWGIACDLEVVKMQNWNRDLHFWDTGLPWVLPSPNLPNIETAFTFVGTVLFEGSNISEGRGTTKSLETVGHPGINNYQLQQEIYSKCSEVGLSGFELRPVSFLPTFQKHAGTVCHGYQIHITDYDSFQPWHLGQLLNQVFYHHLGDAFQWKQPPYEYEENLLPIDILNGTDKVRKWVESNAAYEILLEIENDGKEAFESMRKDILLY